MEIDPILYQSTAISRACKPKLPPHISSLKAALPTSFASLVSKVYPPCLPRESWIWAVRYSIEEKKVATWVFKTLKTLFLVI